MTDISSIRIESRPPVADNVVEWGREFGERLWNKKMAAEEAGEPFDRLSEARMMLRDPAWYATRHGRLSDTRIERIIDGLRIGQQP